MKKIYLILVMLFATMGITAHAEAVDVNLSRPGLLNEEVLLQAKSLSTVHKLTVTGTINEDDWSCISTQMTALDTLYLENATTNFEVVKTFNAHVSVCSLPKGIKSLTWTTYLRNLKEIKLNEGLEDIGNEVFEAAKITHIDFPSSIKYIGYEAFYESSLKSIDMSHLTNVNFEGRGNLSGFMFGRCFDLTSVKLPNDIISIPSSMFISCSNLSEITFPTTLKEIGGWAFDGCKSLTELVIPQSVTTIGEKAFNNCSGLKKVTSLSPFPVKSTKAFFDGIDKENCTLIVPKWCELLYKLAVGWSEFTNIDAIETGNLDAMTIIDDRDLPASVRPTGTPDVNIESTGSLSVRGDNSFAMNELTLGINATSEQKYYYDDNDNIVYYLSGYNSAMLYNDDSNLSVRSAQFDLATQGAAWHFIAMPFDVNADDIIVPDTTKCIFKAYDGSRRAQAGMGSSWVEVKNGLKAGQGYICQTERNGQIQIKAAPETANRIVAKTDVRIALEAYPSNVPEDAGWNFVGNPYPTRFDISQIEHNGPLTVWNGKGYTAYSTADDSYNMYPFEAFFVQKQADSESIVFRATGRNLDTKPNGPNRAPARINHGRTLYNITLSDGNYTDNCRVVINPAATYDYNPATDAAKFVTEGIPQVYSMQGSTKYAINERPMGDGEIPMGVTLPSDGMYTFACHGQPVYLLDYAEGKAIDLSTGAYQFEGKAGKDYTRFAIAFDPAVMSVSSAEVVRNVSVNVSGKLLTVNHNLDADTYVYSADGKQVGYSAAKDSTYNLSTGVYIVRVGNRTYKVVVR